MKRIQYHPGKAAPGPVDGCDHKNVIAYTVFRTASCARCGALLDPFDVLVDMLKGAVPPYVETRMKNVWRMS